jgi:hypothetical protein
MASEAGQGGGEMSLDFMLTDNVGSEMYSRNITHNLAPMAKAAGVYDCLWRPDENGFETARQISAVLANGLLYMADRREELEALNPENGWGDCEGFFEFVSDVLLACVLNPDAKVEVSR